MIRRIKHKVAFKDFLTLFMKVDNYCCLFFLVALLLSSFASHAQNIPPKNINTPTDSLSKTHDAYSNSQLDLGDIAKSLLKKKNFNQNDSSKINYSFLPAIGYSLQTRLAGVFSTNLAFYTNPAHSKEKISSIISSVAYTQNKQIIFPIQAVIWTKKDKYNVIVDWRYLNYPSTTFGLGGNSKINNGYKIDFNYIRFRQSLLRKISGNIYAGLGYYFDYLWNIQEINPPAGKTDFERYGLSKSTTASGIAYRVLIDTRHNQVNAKQGWYVNIVDRTNYKFLGSSASWQSLLAEFRTYITFKNHPKNVLALWSYNWLTLGGKPPYLLLPSTGWDDYSNTGRGYIQGRYRGRQMLYFEAEYRFGISQNGLFGGVVFANAQSFSKTISQQFSVIAPAFGAGLRIKLNKYSGANLCIDYGIGIDGSRGLFVNLGEVF